MLDHRKNKGIPKKSTSASLTTLKSLTLWITTNWKILKEMGIPDHLICFLRNMYAWSWISSLWSAMKCPVMSYEMSMVLGWLLSACILELRAVFQCCWRICMVYLSLELVGSWVVLGFSVSMEAFDKLLSINVPWSQEFSGVLRIWT